MAVSETSVKYVSADGREFANRADAERHDTIETARRAYEQARNTFGRLIAESQNTKDGVPFQVFGYHRYYCIRNVWGRMPYMEEASFSLPVFYLDHTDEVVFTHGNYHEDRREWRVSELYHHKKNAEAALIEALDEYLAEVKRQTDELREKLG